MDERDIIISEQRDELMKQVSDAHILRSRLENLFVGTGKRDFEALERRLDVFCPFEAVGMVRQEIRHAHFLSYILDPKRPHGLGTDVLRNFLMTIASVSELDVFDIHLRNLEAVTIRREWQRVDLLIDIPAEGKSRGWVVVVELKIDAEESENQLEAYEKVVEQQFKDKKPIFVYLTKRRDDATRDRWSTLGLEDVIEGFNQLSFHSENEVGDGARLLRAYLDMLRRHHLEDRELDELAARLWKEHKEALEFLLTKKTDPITEFFRSFRQDGRPFLDKVAVFLNERIGDGKHGFSADSNNGTLRKPRFTVDAWNDWEPLKSGDGSWTKNQHLIAWEIKENNGRLFLNSILGPGDDVMRQRIYDQLQRYREANSQEAGWSTRSLSKVWFTMSGKVLIENLDEIEFSEANLGDEIAKRVAEHFSGGCGISAHEEILSKAFFE